MVRNTVCFGVKRGYTGDDEGFEAVKDSHRILEQRHALHLVLYFRNLGGIFASATEDPKGTGIVWLKSAVGIVP